MAKDIDVNIRLKPSEWKRIGNHTLAEFLDHTFNKAKDINNAKFNPYSERGSKWVTMNVRKEFKASAPKEGYSYKDAKEGNMLKFQAADSANTTAPYLVGDLKKDFNIISASANGFKFGALSFGARVSHLEDKGRVISTKVKALADPVARFLNNMYNKTLKRKLGKDKTHRINVKAGR